PELLQQYPGSAIVYCKTRRQTQRISELLLMKGFSADHYHAGLSHDLRSRKQEAWLSGSTRVMVSTNAFGMGIDKPDVRIVIHAESPDCLENYYQEAGRAGRDGKASAAILLTNEAEFEVMRDQSEIRFPEYSQLKKIYIALMNFLQVPAGSGEGRNFDIDISTFATNFKFDTLQAYYGIQALAKCGLLFFNESFSNPSTIEFTCRREDLSDIEKIYPELYPVVQGLLRSYEGILDSTTTIHESQLAAFSGISYGTLITRLHALHKTGFINYKMQSEKPQVYLLLNRMYQDDFKADTKALKELKHRYDTRLAKMQEYVNDRETCRSIFIAEYFGSEQVQPCEVCDNCSNRTPAKEADISRLAHKILARLSPTIPTSLSDIDLENDRARLNRAILFLQEEQLIRADEKGNLLKGK
ncbi:MAG: RecQ family ATP-dependent DNA helicase, partial [Chitinophagaceae bacterium]